VWGVFAIEESSLIYDLMHSLDTLNKYEYNIKDLYPLLKIENFVKMGVE